MIGCFEKIDVLSLSIKCLESLQHVRNVMCDSCDKSSSSHILIPSSMLLYETSVRESITYVKLVLLLLHDAVLFNELEFDSTLMNKT